MHTLGRYSGASRSLEGDLIITFSIDDEEELAKLEEMSDQDLVIDVQKFRDRRSDRANRYFWKLCDLIAKALDSDKDTIHLMKLRDHGVFKDYEIPKASLDLIKNVDEVSFIKILYSFSIDLSPDESIEMVAVRCFIGSHTYDTKQMSDLIHGTVADAQDLGIETWTPAEIQQALDCWKART